MTEKRVTTVQELIEHIERDWVALNSLLGSLSEKQWTGITNPDGWTVKDHVAHLTVWEKSVIAFLKKKPRHKSLGVSEKLYIKGGIDLINKAIFIRNQAKPLAEVETAFRKTHAQLLQIINELRDDDLRLPYSAYTPGDDDSPGPSAMNIVYGNTAHHYRTHQQWIEEQLDLNSGET